MPYKNKTIGIIGGMGPLATADLFRKLVELEASDTDQGHVRILVDCDSNIPDRSGAIYSGGESPVSEMVRCAIGLERGGADVLIMGCNIAHYFYDDILPYTRIPFLSILEETCKAIQAKNLMTVGIMGCEATMRTGIYERVLQRFGIRYLHPSDSSQVVINQLIDNIKAGQYPSDLVVGMRQAVEELTVIGAQALVLGCTELPIAFGLLSISCLLPLVDPTAEIAKSALRFLGRSIKA
jgi:aspartate racemase